MGGSSQGAQAKLVLKKLVLFCFSPSDHYSVYLQNLGRVSVAHHTALDDTTAAIIRDSDRKQEKGVLAKGVSAESIARARKQKYPRILGPSSAFGTQSATPKRGVHVHKNPLLRTLVLVPEITPKYLVTTTLLAIHIWN